MSGPIGAGKSELAQRLRERYGATVIKTRDLIRKQLPSVKEEREALQKSRSVTTAPQNAPESGVAAALLSTAPYDIKRVAVTPQVEVAGVFYYLEQNNYSTTPCTGSGIHISSGSCAGVTDLSALRERA